MLRYFENRKTTYFDVFCLNLSIEMKIKTLFLISYFNLSKKKNEMALWVHGLKDLCQSFFFNKVAGVRQIARNYEETVLLIKKETLAQKFSCEFWEIFKNTFST